MNRILATALFLAFVAPAVQGATKYLRSGATGANTGNNWTDAYTSLSTLESNLGRGDTGYVADGSYGSATFNTSASGSSVITIKKATASDHGTDAGWNDAYGDGQAVFNSTLSFNSDNWVLDGMRRNENDWFDGGSYGFKIAHNGRDQNIIVQANNVVVQYVFIDAQVSLPSNTIRRYAVDTDSYGGPTWTGLIFRRMYVYGSNNIWFIRTTRGTLVEYCASENAQSNGGNHGEIWNVYFSVYDAVIRYNQVRNAYLGSPGTALVAMNENSGLEFYGNVAWDFATTDGVVGFVGGSASGNRVLNNTFVRGSSWNSGVTLEGPGNLVQNNLWIDCGTTYFSVSGTTSHNGFTGGDAKGTSSAQLNINPNTLFADYGGNDFTLATDTVAGTELAAPYNTDMFGNERGADGTWDRGAFEFGSANPNLTVDAGPDQNVTLPASAVLEGSHVNQLGGTPAFSWSTVSGPGSVSFSAPTAENTTATFSSTGTYRLRFTATVVDVAASDDVNVTVQAPPDNTPPTVTLTSPSDGTTVSNAVPMTATASDNIGVEGVRFLVNGAMVFDDGTSPYSVMWDSTLVANGSYSVVAEVRDVAGNTAQSAASTITVDNNVAALPNPVAYWGFNEGAGTEAADPVAGNSLALRNGASWAGSGKSGNGLRLDGQDAYAEAANSASLDINGNTLSVAAWVRLENNDSWQQILAKVKETGDFSAPYFSWHLFAGPVSSTEWRPQFQVVNANETSVNVSSAATANFDQWVHVVGVYDGSTSRLYVNGVEEGSAALSGNVMSYNEPLYIGAHGLPGEFAKGVVDEVRIYAQPLSAAQVRLLYNVPVPVPPAPAFKVTR